MLMTQSWDLACSVIELRASLALYIQLWVSKQKDDQLVRSLLPIDSSALLTLLKDVLYQASLQDIPFIMHWTETSIKEGSESKAWQQSKVVLKKQLHALVRMLEHALSCMYMELKTNKNDSGRSALDLDNLQRLCEPSIANLEQYVASGILPGDMDSFEVLLRRTKAQLYGYSKN